MPDTSSGLETEAVYTTTYCLCPGLRFDYHELTCLHNPFYKKPVPSPYAGKKAWRKYEAKS